jgi:hypothetical protein
LDEEKSACIMLYRERICFMRISKDTIIFNVPLRWIEDSSKTSIGEYPVVGAIAITFGWTKQVGYWLMLHQLAISPTATFGVSREHFPPLQHIAVRMSSTSDFPVRFHSYLEMPPVQS